MKIIWPPDVASAEEYERKYLEALCLMNEALAPISLEALRVIEEQLGEAGDEDGRASASGRVVATRLQAPDLRGQLQHLGRYADSVVARGLRESATTLGELICLLETFLDGDPFPVDEVRVAVHRMDSLLRFPDLWLDAATGIEEHEAALVVLVELEERLGVSNWKHLTTSHVRVVFGLAENHQKKLLSDGGDLRGVVRADWQGFGAL